MNFNTNVPNAILSCIFFYERTLLLWWLFRFGYFPKGSRFSIGMTLQSFQKYSIIHDIDISLDVFEANMNISGVRYRTNMSICFFRYLHVDSPFTRAGICADERERETTIVIPSSWHRCPRDNYAIPARSFEFMLRGRRGSNRNKFLALFRREPSDRGLHPHPAFYRVRVCLVSRIRRVSSLAWKTD